MKNILSKYRMVFLSVLFVSIACKKQLQVEPRQSLDASVALTTVTGIDNALNSVYASLKNSLNYGRDLIVIAEALGDRTFSNGRGNRFTSDNQNALNTPFTFWTSSYSSINEVNLILEALPGVNTTETNIARWEGELKFLRALQLFNIAKVYAYIPTFIVAGQDKGGVIITTTGISTPQQALNFKPARAPIAEVYASILADLDRSIALLSNTNRGAYYASKMSALALASRVALFQGDYVKTEAYATAAIAANGIGTLTTAAAYVAGWRTALNPESIFEVRFTMLSEVPTIANGIQGAITNMIAVGNITSINGGFGPLVPNIALMTELGLSFAPAPNATTLSFGSGSLPVITRSNDVRNQLYDIGPNVSGRWIECTKYMGKSGGLGVDNVPVLRWPELYLNRAEARARLATPNIAGANADLNELKSRRYTGFVVPANLTDQALLDEILKQRNIEFAFEGYRYFDMKRLGLPIIKTTPAVNLPNTTFRYNNQIPTAEVDGNPNMVQNFGY